MAVPWPLRRGRRTVIPVSPGSVWATKLEGGLVQSVLTGVCDSGADKGEEMVRVCMLVCVNV